MSDGAANRSIPEGVLKQVRGIEIRTRKLVNEIFSGQYSSVFKGRGMEFSQVREYQPGDDPKLIDWNVSARTGHIFTKEFLEERELTVLLLIDASRSLFFGSRKNLKSEIAAEIAALLSFSAIRNNDKVGLLIFTDKVEKYIPPRKGQRAILRLIREILTFQPEGNATSIGAGLEFLGKVIKRRAVCFLMSDFLTDENYENALRGISKRHDITALRITDPLENEFPIGGRFLMRDLETGKLKRIHFKSKEGLASFKNNSETAFTRWKKNVEKLNVDVIEIRTGESYVKQLLGFFRKRARRFR